jgi:membrane protease YdiL (CAAX protease family)
LSFDSNPFGESPDRRAATPEIAPAAPEISPAIPAEILPPGSALRPAPIRRENPVWSGWDVALLVVVFFVALVGVTWTALPLARRLPSMQHMTAMAVLQRPIVVIAIEAAAELVVLLFMIWLVRVYYRRPFWPAVRWNFPHARWAAFLTIGFALALALAPFESGLEKVAPSPKQLPIDQMFSSTAAAYCMALFGTLIAPLMEEVFFRGFMYPVLNRRFGATLAVLFTAVAFAALHGAQLAHAVAPLAVIFVVGLVLTLVRARTKSVASSMLVHMGYNGALFLMAWYGSDHFRHLEKLT